MEKEMKYEALTTKSNWAMAQQLNELKKENNVKIELIFFDSKEEVNAIVLLTKKQK